MTAKDGVTVKIYELPGVVGGCSCGSMGCSPEMAAILQQKIAELRSTLEEAYPGRIKVEYVNLKENPAERESEIGQLLVTGKYPGPLVVINGEPKFAGSILGEKIRKEVEVILG
jgi:hypothetical protein